MTKTSRGFTLIELLVVLAIAALVSTVAAVRVVGSLDGAELKGETRHMLAALRAARTDAVVAGVVTGIGAGDDPASYRRYPDDQDVLLPDGMSVTVDAPPALNGAASHVITFYPDGSSSGGEIALESAAGEYRITVHWLTGEAGLIDVR